MSKRRPAIGPHDWLDVVTGNPPAPNAPRREARPPKPKAATKGRVERTKRVTFHLPVELVDEARNAVVALSGPPVRLTLARLVADALRRELARLQRDHHQGEPWPRRAGELVGGRPIGS